MTPAPADLVQSFAHARADAGLVVLEGFHALKHALRFGAVVETVAATDPDALEALAAELAPDLAGRFSALATPVDAATLRSLTAQPHHTGVAAIARRPPFALAGVAADAPIVLLEDPRRLGNVGAVVRVAAAANAAAVVTTGTVDPWDPAALRGSAGLHFALPVGRLDRVAARPQAPASGTAAAPAMAATPESRPARAAPGAATPAGAAPAAATPAGAAPATATPAGAAPATATPAATDLAGRPLLALDPAGEAIVPARIPPGAVLAFGTERDGLSDELLANADARLRLPMRDGVSSLNLATAVAAVLFARRLAG